MVVAMEMLDSKHLWAEEWSPLLPYTIPSCLLVSQTPLLFPDSMYFSSASRYDSRASSQRFWAASTLPMLNAANAALSTSLFLEASFLSSKQFTWALSQLPIEHALRISRFRPSLRMPFEASSTCLIASMCSCTRLSSEFNVGFSEAILAPS